MRRLPAITQDRMSPEQRDLFESITGGDRGRNRPVEDFLDAEGGLGGPFNAYLYAPGLGDAAQRLGQQIRYHSSLPGPLRELAILAVGAHWRAGYEWWAHEKVARQEGLDDAALAAVKAGQPPRDADQATVHRFVREILETHNVGDETHAAARDLLGDKGVVELVTLVGYYCLISANLNVFRVPVPDGETPPFG